MKWYRDLVDPISSPEITPRPPNWSNRPEQISLHQSALQTVLKMDFGKPEQAKGRGIVYVGGGAYWVGIVIGIRMLREAGCDLPVQIYHRGQKEPVQPEQVRDLGDVTIIDSEAMAEAKGGCRILRGWEQKLFALVHCGFEQVIYLDADAYLVAKPDDLFNQLSIAPFVYWEDLANTQSNLKFHAVCPWVKTKVPPVQGGQLIIDRVRAWRILLAAHWMNQHSDFYYQHMFGDQDTWRAVLSALTPSDKPWWLCLGKAEWKATAFLCGLPGASPAIVHRCQGKLMDPASIPATRRGYNSPQWVLPKEKRVFEILTHLVQQDDKKSESVFGNIYQKNLWATSARSGGGSTGDEAQAYIDLMNILIRFTQSARVVDLGCGDGHIGSKLQVAHYVGIDCHAPHIEKLSVDYPAREWKHLDFYQHRDDLPSGDIALMKDVLHHWPNSMIHSWLSWAQSCNKWKYIFFTQDVHQVADNNDTYLGGYRALNPKMDPLKEFRLQTVIPYHHKYVLMME